MQELRIISRLLITILLVTPSVSKEYDKYGEDTFSATYACPDAIDDDGACYQIEGEDNVKYSVSGVPVNSSMWRTDQAFYRAQFQAQEFPTQNFQYFCEPEYLNCSNIQKGHTEATCWCELEHDNKGAFKGFKAFFSLPRTSRYRAGAPMRIYWETFQPLKPGAGNMIRVFKQGLPPSLTRSRAEELGYCGVAEQRRKKMLIIAVASTLAVIVAVIGGVAAYKKRQAGAEKSHSQQYETDNARTVRFDDDVLDKGQASFQVNGQSFSNRGSEEARKSGETQKSGDSSKSRESRQSVQSIYSSDDS